MHAMLHDTFGMHEVRKTTVSMRLWCKGMQKMWIYGVIDEKSARMYYNLIKKVEKPLHDKTKESKLSTIVHMYNMKCVGGLSNSIFSYLLE